MDKVQIEILNNLLRTVGELRKEDKQENLDSNVYDMIEKYNKNNTYFYFQVYLLEMIPKRNGAFIYINNIFPNVSPQEIYLGYLKGNNLCIKYKEIFTLQNGNINLLKMVTPNLNKNIWYLEKDLICNRLIRIICKMNLSNMKNMLKTCPLPDICFCPSEYKIDDPETFIKIINNIEDKKIFDFIPYVRKYSIKNNYINNKSVYYLYNNIQLIKNNCFK